MGVNQSKLSIRYRHFLQSLKSQRSFVKLDSDPHLDPDPHWEKQLDPDLQKINADPQPWLKPVLRIRTIFVCESVKWMESRYVPRSFTLVVAPLGTPTLTDCTVCSRLSRTSIRINAVMDGTVRYLSPLLIRIRIDLAWIRRIRIKVRPVTGSVTHFVQILDPDPYKTIRIRNTDAPDYKIRVFI